MHQLVHSDWSKKRELTRDLDRGVSGSVSLDVSYIRSALAIADKTGHRKLRHTEVTNVSLRVGGSTVVLAERVEVGSGRGAAVAEDACQLGRRGRTGAMSLRVVSKLAGQVSACDYVSTKRACELTERGSLARR